MDLLKKRYFLKDKNGNYIENSWENICNRVAINIASAEETKELQDTYGKIFYDKMVNLEFIPSSPTLFNAGTTLQQLSSCFIIDIEDSMEGIAEAWKECSIIFKSGGGAGFNTSKIRPKGTLVNTSNGEASGVVSFMTIFDQIVEIIKQGGKRKGALKIDLNENHPEIFNFINCKDNDETLKNMNISVSISDKFMNALLNDENVNLEFNGKIYKTIKAKELWDEIIESAWKTGEPGISFRDIMNDDNKNPHLGEINGSNPCMEYVNIPYSSCNLGSINLEMVIRDKKVDYKILEENIRIAVRFLDNMITVNKLPLEKIDKITKAIRPIGLGTIGYANMLYMLEIPYNSKQAYKITDKIYEFIKQIAIDESTKLAEEKGTYPAWEGSVWQKENIKIRNCNHISIAPNGSIGFIANSTGGIEPEYALVYNRTTNEGTKYFVVNKIFEQKLKELNLYSEELLQKIVDINGSIQNIKEIPNNIRKIFVVSHDLKPNEHLKTLSIINKYVDLSISKCVAEGTLIQTNQGVIPIEELGKAKGVDVFDEPLDDLMIIDENGDWKKVTKHYSGGKQKTKKIYLDNGNVIEGTFVHKIKTLNGWKQLKDIEVNDYIECRFADYENRKGNLLLPKLLQENKTNNNVLKIPDKMNKDFALFLGMICADGSLIESTGAVQLTCADDEVEKTFIKLTQKLFDVNPRITYDKRTKNTRTITITSRSLVRWLNSLIGNNCTDKFIPSQILKGSIEEQKAFLKGITLDGYIKKLDYDRNEFCIYEGYSEKLADGIMAICFSLGLSPYKNTKYVKNGRSHNMTYGITIDSNEIIPLEKHKFCMCSSKRRLVAVPEKIKELKLSTKHDFYNSLRTIRKNGYTVVYNTTLDKARYRYNNDVYYVHVKNIVDSEANVFDIEVEDTHSYLINGVVSHNTINLPNSATKEEISEVYIEAWKNNIKGITVYRDGSRKNQVLSTSENKEQKISKLPRGYILPALTESKGHRIKLTTGCGHLWLMVFTDDNNDIVETFVNTGSKGGCTISTQAMSRLMSLALRGGISFEDVVDQLESAGSCPAYQFARGNGNKISSGKSCPSAIAKALDKLQKKLKKGEQISTIEIEEENVCPECNTKLIFKEGCVTCFNCGFSKCN